VVFAFFNLGAQEMVILLLSGALVVWPFWRIFSRAGLPGWLALGVFIPLSTLILLYYLAFAGWPNASRAGAQPGRQPDSEGHT
jgi:hypothetical protein